MAILIERKPSSKKKHEIFKASGTQPEKRIKVDEKESILEHIRQLPPMSEIVVPTFKEAFLTQTDFKRIIECILEKDIHLLFADMSLPEISRDVWHSKEAKPYVDMIFAFLDLSSRAKPGAKVGPPVLIEAHRNTIIAMTKEGASPPEIAKKIGFNRNTVYNYIRNKLPELKRDNRLSDGWKTLDSHKKRILAELNKGTARYRLMEEYEVSPRIFTKWLEKNGYDQSKREKLNITDVRKMLKQNASIDTMRKAFHVAPSTMKEYLKEHFPEYYQKRFEARNKTSVLMKHKAKIIKALKAGKTKKALCEEYEISYMTLMNFLEKIDY